jgi:hypothetical protein
VRLVGGVALVIALQLSASEEHRVGYDIVGGEQGCT